MRFVDPLIQRDREWLQALQRQVLEASYDHTSSALSYFFESLDGMAPTHDVLNRLRFVAETDPVVVAYLKPDPRALPKLPLASELRAAGLLGVCERVAKAGLGGGGTPAVMALVPFIGLGEAPKERLETFKRDIFSPLVDEVERSLTKGDWVLALLWRYKREVEWFEQDELLARFAPDGRDGKGWAEADLDRHLRRFLHRSGVAFPFSQTDIPEGRPDIVLPSEENPLPIEVKVFDGLNRGISQIVEGAHQALNYAHKYQSPFGYLVVFNVTDAWIQIGAEPKPGVPRFDFQNKAILIVPIQVVKTGAPSKRGKSHTVVITEEQLQ